MIKKKMLFTALAIALMASMIVQAAPAQLLADLVNFKIVFNGTDISFANEVVTINDRTYIPLREAAEGLGMDVDWNEETREILVNSAQAEEKTLYPFKMDGLYGFMDKTGRIVIEPIYYVAGDFYEGLAQVHEKPGAGFGYINKSGKIVIPCKYKEAWDFSEGKAVVSDGGKSYFYINRNGKPLFDRKFLFAFPFKEGVACVEEKEGEYHYIDANGNDIGGRTLTLQRASTMVMPPCR